MGAQIDWKSLAAHAWAAREKAYAPYSNFAVGAALFKNTGDVFAGCNVENVSFGLTICAEGVAVLSAIQAGFRHFSGLVVVAETVSPVMPCGACRQFLAEFEPALPIHCGGAGGVQSVWLLFALLPSTFQGPLNR